MKYNPEDINEINHKTFSELYKETLIKKEILENAGYKVVSIWESEWKKILKANKIT